LPDENEPAFKAGQKNYAMNNKLSPNSWYFYKKFKLG